MTIWWLNNIARANYEREELAKLAEKSEWAKNLSVALGDGNLSAEIDFELGDTVYELVLTYPVVFPDAPPLVKTRDGKRISGHQYGASGELCLEYRPDNWSSDVTGAMMIESAFKLLSVENRQEGASAEAIIDGHAVSIGQATRTTFGRFVLCFPDWLAFQNLSENALYNGTVNEVWLDKKLSARLIRIGTAEAPIYASESRFPDLKTELDAFIVRNPSASLPAKPQAKDIQACIAGAEGNENAIKQLEELGEFYFLVILEECTLYWVSFKADEPFVIAYRTLKEPAQQRRLPDGLELSDRKVGIVGCGSLGSKVAMQLARTGVGAMVLLDDDVFFEGNLVRNELSVSDIGFHKSRALRKRLHAVNPSLRIETRQIRLGGQESSETIVSAMKQLSECDVIVDATADAAAFNIISAVCRRAKIPAVWGSVFAGGIGGVIGRALPDRDPEPLDARQQIRRWCDAQGVEPLDINDNAGEYEAQGEDGEPVVATDADVSLLASHVARFTLDSLTPPDQTIYPYSAYVIGLEEQWIFKAPFDTRPIEYTGQKVWSSEGTVATPEELADFLKLVVPLEVDSGT